MKLLCALLFACGLAAAQSTSVPVKQLAAPVGTATTGTFIVAVQNGVFTVLPYSAATPAAAPNFVDGETYNFAVGSTAPVSITLAHTPIATSPHVYRNGVRLSINEDFKLAGAVLTFAGANLPAAGDKFVIDYRY